MHTGPVGQGHYTVRDGDCMSSIAERYGFFWQTLWDLPENAELKRVRQNPNILLAGDRVTVPPLRMRQEQRATDARHMFQRRGTPAKLVMRFLASGEPRGGEEYVLNVDGDVRVGHLSREGELYEKIPPTAREVTVSLGDGEPIMLTLGSLDPLSEVSGVQGRLNNLGFAAGAVDGVLGPVTEYAIREFQRRYELTETGRVDAAFLGKLGEIHGS